MMRRFAAVLILSIGMIGVASADIWKWVDDKGRVHFVDTKTPIYTWEDQHGNIQYSDTPDHEDAVSVELVWVSEGTLENTGPTNEESESGGFAYPGETPEQRAAREKAEAYYCQRATEVYDSYVKAPRLYTTDGGGDRKYLDEKEAEKLISETRARVDEYCN